MSDIDAIRERQAVGYYSKDPLAEAAIETLLAEVDAAEKLAEAARDAAEYKSTMAELDAAVTDWDAR